MGPGHGTPLRPVADRAGIVTIRRTRHLGHGQTHAGVGDVSRRHGAGGQWSLKWPCMFEYITQCDCMYIIV